MNLFDHISLLCTFFLLLLNIPNFYFFFCVSCVMYFVPSKTSLNFYANHLLHLMSLIILWNWSFCLVASPFHFHFFFVLIHYFYHFFCVFVHLLSFIILIYKFKKLYFAIPTTFSPVGTMYVSACIFIHINTYIHNGCFFHLHL